MISRAAQPWPSDWTLPIEDDTKYLEQALELYRSRTGHDIASFAELESSEMSEVLADAQFFKRLAKCS